jgi:acyl-CoA synthetase (AMP-forming)/AMP-acid ligase II
MRYRWRRRRCERADERPKAYVVPARRVGEPELIEYVAARVAPHKRIHVVAFIDAIPTSPSGKTLWRLLVAGDRAKATGQRG